VRLNCLGVTTSFWRGTFGVGARRTGTNYLEFPTRSSRSGKMFAECCAQHVADWVWRQVLVSFLYPLLIPFIYQCLLHVSMSGTNSLPGAHDFVMSGTTNTARIVRETVGIS